MLGGLCQKYAVVAALMNSGLEARKCQKRRRLSTACHFLNKQVHKVSTIRTNTYFRLKYAEVKRFTHTFVEHDLRHTGRPLLRLLALVRISVDQQFVSPYRLLPGTCTDVQIVQALPGGLAFTPTANTIQNSIKQLRLEIHLPQAPSRVKLGTLWRSVHCQRLLSTVVQFFSCHGPAKVSKADGHSSHVKADKAGPICASKPPEEENPNIVLSAPDTLKIP